MSDSRMKFDDQDFGNQSIRGQRVTGIAGFLIKNSGGLIKTQKGANTAMILLIIICVALILITKPESPSNDDGLVAPPGKTIEYPVGGPPRIK